MWQRTVLEVLRQAFIEEQLQVCMTVALYLPAGNDDRLSALATFHCSECWNIAWPSCAGLLKLAA